MKRKLIPRLEFRAASIDEYIPVINGFLNSDWRGAILSTYPVLKRRLGRIRSQARRDIITYQFFRQLQEKSPLKQKAEMFQAYWKPLNRPVMRALSEAVEMPWPEALAKITARVTLNPICPRYLKLAAFDVFVRDWNEAMQDVVLHELLHFIYFEKWKSIFPRVSEDEFESPHLVWALSELVVRPILSDSRFQALWQATPVTYDRFFKSKVCGRSLLEHIQQIYDERDSFEDFLKKAFRFAKRHRRSLCGNE